MFARCVPGAVLLSQTSIASGKGWQLAVPLKFIAVAPKFNGPIGVVVVCNCVTNNSGGHSERTNMERFSGLLSLLPDLCPRNVLLG